VPDEVAAAVAARPETRVYASERLADWLLWKRPVLRRRVAFDARVELLGRGEVDRIVDFESGLLTSGWPVTAYPIVVLTPDDSKAISVLMQDRTYRPLAADARAVALLRG
jgi:hypothetical protein